MKRPFVNTTIPHAHNVGTCSCTGAGNVGGVAPHSQTQGIRRDFTTTPQFIPSLTINGGLKQPPRG